MQTALSFVAGVILGIGVLHLIPHAYYELRSLDKTMLIVLCGFFNDVLHAANFSFSHARGLGRRR